MTNRKHSVVIVGAGEKEQAIRKQIEDLVEIRAVEPDPGRGLAAVRETAPTIVLLCLDSNPEAILAIAKEISINNSCLPIVFSANRDPENILKAMRSGARDFAYLDEESADIRRAITHLGKLQEQVKMGGLGKVIAVFGAKGGSGATTIASNLAGEMLTHGRAKGATRRKVALLDFDLEMGDVLVFLDLESQFSYVDLLNNMHRLDSELLYQSLAIHPSGLCVLSQTDQLEGARDISAEEVSRVIDFLRQHFDFVVIDGLRDFREMALAGLDGADSVILTMTQDIPALKNANRCLQLFKRLGYADRKIKLLLNRYRRTNRLTVDAIADALGREVDATVANDYPSVIKAINQGELLVHLSSRSRVANDIKNLVTFFLEGTAVKRHSLFPRWGRK